MSIPHVIIVITIRMFNCRTSLGGRSVCQALFTEGVNYVICEAVAIWYALPSVQRGMEGMKGTLVTEHLYLFFSLLVLARAARAMDYIPEYAETRK